MAFNDLTSEQQDAVQALATFVRATAGELARVANHGRTVANYYVGNIETILGGLQNSDEIPNASGLAGAQPLTKAELVNLVGYMLVLSDTGDGVSGSYNSNYHRGLYAKAAGPGALVG